MKKQLLCYQLYNEKSDKSKVKLSFQLQLLKSTQLPKRYSMQSLLPQLLAALKSLEELDHIHWRELYLHKIEQHGAGVIVHYMLDSTVNTPIYISDTHNGRFDQISQSLLLTREVDYSFTNIFSNNIAKSFLYFNGVEWVKAKAEMLIYQDAFTQLLPDQEQCSDHFERLTAALAKAKQRIEILNQLQAEHKSLLGKVEQLQASLHSMSTRIDHYQMQKGHFFSEVLSDCSREASELCADLQGVHYLRLARKIAEYRLAIVKIEGKAKDANWNYAQFMAECKKLINRQVQNCVQKGLVSIESTVEFPLTFADDAVFNYEFVIYQLSQWLSSQDDAVETAFLEYFDISDHKLIWRADTLAYTKCQSAISNTLSSQMQALYELETCIDSGMPQPILEQLGEQVDQFQQKYDKITPKVNEDLKQCKAYFDCKSAVLADFTELKSLHLGIKNACQQALSDESVTDDEKIVFRNILTALENISFADLTVDSPLNQIEEKIAEVKLPLETKLAELTAAVKIKADKSSVDDAQQSLASMVTGLATQFGVSVVSGVKWSLGL